VSELTAFVSNLSGRRAAQLAARERLTAAGYRLNPKGRFEPGEIQRATIDLLGKLAPFGAWTVLDQLLGGLRERDRYGWGVYLKRVCRR
jgi:hypothetical protein